jgi:hypothetical protein
MENVPHHVNVERSQFAMLLITRQIANAQQAMLEMLK